MCGICGMVNTHNKEKVSLDILLRMRDALIHRGPDDAGELLDMNVGLAMRRLNVIDLNTGHQPIHNEDETVWIVFNGEIYNFLELRNDLEKKGHIFYTKSDTEVIVHLYEEEGAECAVKLNGMFAFALWDKPKKRLLLARDRMGQKPLYYAFKNGQFIFSSEIKSLLQHPFLSRELDLDSLNEYFTFEYIPAPRSIFKEIKKLPASHTMILEGGNLQIERYWNPQFTGSNNISEVEAEEKLLLLMKQSVKRHLIADVPIGVFLSGGIDSSTIAALASPLVNGKLKTFSIAFEDRSFNESGYARFVADYIGSEHYELRFNGQDCLSIIPSIYKILDEPFADASFLPTYILSKFTKKYVTVALGGDGSDELFCGYPTHLAHYYADKSYLRIPFLFNGGFLKALSDRLPTSFDNFSLDFRIKKFISGIGFTPEIRHQIWMGSFSPQQKKRLFLPSLKNKLMSNDGLDPIFKYLEEIPLQEHADIQTKILLSDMRLYLQDDILTKVDRASMANSLEVRSPFLDCNLVEFVTGLPGIMKLRRFQTKFILKKMLLKNRILPPQIINRTKKGFGIPVAKWINQELKSIVTDFLSEKRIRRGGLFDYHYIKQLLVEHFAGKKDNRKFIWTLFMFEFWKEEYL